MSKSEIQFSILSAILLIVILGFLVYSNTFHSSFQFDDSITIVNNQAVHNIKNLRLIWESFNTRFLTGLTFAFNYYTCGLDVFSYHLVNTAIHILAAISVYFFVILTFETPYFARSPLKENAHLVALFSSLIFLVHPIQTQGVTYITQRATSMATLFYLVSLIFYIKSRLEARSLFRIISLIVAILAMFTKEMTIMIPFTLLVYEFFFFGPWKKDGKKRLYALIPFLMTFAIIPLALISDVHTHSVLGLKGELFSSKLYATYFFTEVDVLRTYLRLLVLPVLQNVDYDYPLSGGLFNFSTFFSLLLLVGLITFAYRQFETSRLLSFCIAWFFITTSVEFMFLTLSGREIIFEHYLYLPMVGFAIFVSSGLFLLSKDKKKVIGILSLIVFVFSILAYNRNNVWRNPVILWQDAVNKSPNKARPCNNLGLAYSRIGEYQKAIDYYLLAILLNNNFAGAYSNLGIEHGRRGDYDKAIKYLKESIRIDPKLEEGYANLGFAHFLKGDYSEAIYNYHHALQYKRNMAQIYTNLAVAYGKKGDYDKEIEYSEKAIELEPGNPVSYNNLGLALAQMGKYQEATKHIKIALKFNPQYSEAHNNLGLVYAKQGYYRRAIESFKKALDLNPNNAEAKNNLRLAQERLSKELTKKKEL